MPKKSTKKATKAKPKPAKHPGGRPKLTFDLKIVEGLGGIGCTYDEMAAVLDCSVDTVRRNMQEEGEFCEAYKKGKASFLMSLRRKQKSIALGDSKSAAMMLVWLGKNLLGQSDKQEVEQKVRQHISFDEDDGAE